MTKKQKNRKRKEPEDITYEIEVNDWKTYYHFGLNKRPTDNFPEVYWEFSNIILSGGIISPDLKIISKANIRINESPELNDHWKNKMLERQPLGIGYIKFEKDDDILEFNCWVSSPSFNNITVTVAHGKVKYVSIFGTKLKWKKGTIFNITLSTDKDEE